MYNPDLYQRALRIAAEAHAGQRVPGTDLPYLLHVAGVAGEVAAALLNSADKTLDGDLAIACALLHDTIEDAGLTFNELQDVFGEKIAKGVLALSKDPALPEKRSRMLDSLARIREQPREVAMVKLADRIVNLQPPPGHWSTAKRRAYREEAQLILASLQGANAYLEKRLEEKIHSYGY